MKPTFFTRVLAGILSITMACLPLHGVAADVQRQIRPKRTTRR